MTQYADIADFDEDKRIDMIGHRTIDHQEVVAFIVDDDVKADRYLKKLQERFPGIQFIARGTGPVPQTVYVKVGPPSGGTT